MLSPPLIYTEEENWMKTQVSISGEPTNQPPRHLSAGTSYGNELLEVLLTLSVDHGAQGWCDLIKSCTDSFITNSTLTISGGKWCFSREFCSSFLSTPYKAWTTWGKFTILVGRKPKHHSRKKWCPSPQIPCTILPRKLRCYSKIRHVLTETKRRMSEPCIQPPHSPRLSDWK